MRVRMGFDSSSILHFWNVYSKLKFLLKKTKSVPYFLLDRYANGEAHGGCNPLT